MAIFRRGRKGHDAVDESLETVGTEDTDVADDEAHGAGFVISDAGDVEDSDETGDTDDTDDTDEDYFSRVRGPFDSAEAAPSEPANRLDLGSIQLVPIDGMQLRLELDEAQQTVLGAHALVEDSGVQLQAFAAPRTMGLWAEIREEIAQSIVSQGGTADVVRGPLGRELIARMPSRGAGGRTVFQPVRFLGVDGPRWFLRAVVSGKAALDEAAAGPLVELVRSVVVVRGYEAKPPREILPLRLPNEMTAEGPAQPAADEEPSEHTGTTRLDELKPFERGPEITEVR